MNPKLSIADAALRQGRKAEALPLLIEALTDDPQASPAIYASLLNLLLESGRNIEGLIWAERAAQCAPKDYAVLNLYGAFLRLAGRRSEALEIFDRAIKLRPNEISARANKGHVYNDAENGAAAEAIFVPLLRQHPRIAELHRALGVALLQQGKVDLAERRFRQAISLDPANIDASLDLSALIMRSGDASAALEIIDQAIARNTELPRLIRAKVALFLNAGLSDRAATYLRSLDPRYGDLPWFNHDLARSLMHSEPDDATRRHIRAIEGDPRNRDFRLILAEHLLRYPSGPEGSHIDRAHAVVSSCPPIPEPKPAETRIRTQIAARAVDVEGVRRWGSFSQLGRQWAEAGMHTALLDHMARVESADDRHELIEQHRLWGNRAIERARRSPIRRPLMTRTSSRIRLGFMSSDLREHPVTYFSLPLFEHVDRDRFEISCYSFYRGSEGPLQRRLASMVDNFRWEPTITDRDAAQMIADDDLDILFELGGSTFMNKLEVMAWKPARLCASWLGYPHSAGLATIDHLLVDPFLNPPDSSLLIEKPLVMPNSWIVMSEAAFPDHYRIDPVAPFRRNGFITFGTANNTYKFNAPLLRAWARIMAKLPNSHFMFIRPEVGAEIVRTNIVSHFAAEGISADRISFRAVRGTHMAHYNEIDIALDTFPQTGGTTTCESLWMGVPTVTLAGEALFERLSHSILSNAGLGDLSTRSVDQFIDTAVALASDSDRLQAMRTGLRDQLRASPLGRPRRFAEDFYDLIARTIADAR